MNDSVKKIQEAIQKKGITQIPKSLFIFQSALLVFSALIVLLLAIFLASLFIFFLKIRGVWLIPSISPYFLKDLLMSLPFFITSILLILSLGILYLSQRTLLTYRYPLIFSVLGVVFVVILGGFGVYLTPLHQNFYAKYRPSNFIPDVFSKDSKTPKSLMQVIYSPAVFPRASNSIVGEVFSSNPANLNLVTDFGICSIILEDSADTSELLNLTKGDWVFIYGQDKDSKFIAKKIKKISSGSIPPSRFAGKDEKLELIMPSTCNFKFQDLFGSYLIAPSQ